MAFTMALVLGVCKNKGSAPLLLPANWQFIDARRVCNQDLPDAE
jgi:hypothetical protein